MVRVLHDALVIRLRAFPLRSTASELTLVEHSNNLFHSGVRVQGLPR